MRTPTLLSLSALLALVPAADASPVGAAWRLFEQHVPERRPEDEVPAYWGPTELAQADLAAGRYRRALLEATDANLPLVAAEARLRLGLLDAAWNGLVGNKAPEADLVRARIAEARGHDSAALAAAREAVDDAPESVVARYELGRLAEATGDLEEARAAYGWFEEQGYLSLWQQDPNAPAFERAQNVVAIGRALDRLATLNAQYRDGPDLHDAILSMFVRAYDVIDRDNPDAHLAAAEFLYARSDPAAAEELEAVLARNPRHAEALRLAGQLNLDRYNFAKANAVTRQLRSVNPLDVSADLLDARNLLLQRQPGEAQPFVDRVLARRSDSIEALGLQAAIHAMRLEYDQADAALARVDALDPDDATALFIVGEQLALRRQYDRAAAALEEAVARAPWWTRPRNELALLYTQSGREADAEAAAAAAFALDPFNRSTLNYLRLLREMNGYARIDTPEFVVRYEADADPLAAELMADTLGPMGADVQRIYGWSPPAPTEIQVFPTHDRFSVRVAGDPYVGTVGACTGPVIALVSPRDGEETLGAYDWHRVMRHEYTHTITLGATGNRIWHWMTEGLAVREEQAPPAQGYLDLLTGATLAGELFPIEELTWGFVRPRKPTDRSQAYAQSWFTCEFIADRWGEPDLAAMMKASGDGLTEREALAEVLETTPESFDGEFQQWMFGQLQSWGRDPASSQQYAAAVEQGESALRRRDWQAAVSAYEAARQVRPLDEPPMRRLAGLYLLPEIDRPADAAAMLAELAVRSTDDNRYAKRAARLFLDANERDAATEAAWLAVRCGPYDRGAHVLLLNAAEASGDEALAAKQRRRLELLGKD